MILNTGQRTDIPAFYSRWFANRLREGFVMVRNPFNPVSVTRYKLDPSVVDLIIFCSKNPAPILPYMDLLGPYHQYWFVTITPYGTDIEPGVPPVQDVIKTFQKISSIVGPDCMAWRYDPIIITRRSGDSTNQKAGSSDSHADHQADSSGSHADHQAGNSDRHTDHQADNSNRHIQTQASISDWSVEKHVAAFEHMASELAGHTHTAIISFIDLYEKVKRNFPEVSTVPLSVQLELTEAFVRIGKKYDMVIKPCAEDKILESVGADCSGCSTFKTFEKAIGQNLLVPSFTPGRKECACYISADIGAYNTCGHLCRYCYANVDADTVRVNMKKHDPASPILTGQLQPDDIIHDARQESWIDYQMRLEF